jgi:hypothetical protein
VKIFLTRVFIFLGFNPLSFFKNVVGIFWYLRNLKELKSQLSLQNDFIISKYYPILTDRNSDSGFIKSHYFWQDSLVARKIFESNPIKHVDVGSRIDGFVTHISSFREIEVFDIRPLNGQIDHVKFVKVDFSKEPFKFENYCDSLSCLHVIEHFGLGRYGDKIDVNGHLKGLQNLKKILKPGGKFYFSTPIGPQRIEFNAHRVFSLSYLIELLSKDYHINSVSIIDDKGYLNKDVILTEDLIKGNYGCNYGCGIFEMTKK